MKGDDIIADCDINGLKHFFNEKGAKPAETMYLVEDLYKAGYLSSEKYEQLSDLIRYNSSENDDLERNDGIVEVIQIARENDFYVSGVNSVDDQLSFDPSDKLDPDTFNVYGHDGLI